MFVSLALVAMALTNATLRRFPKLWSVISPSTHQPAVRTVYLISRMTAYATLNLLHVRGRSSDQFTQSQEDRQAASPEPSVDPTSIRTIDIVIIECEPRS